MTLSRFQCLRCGVVSTETVCPECRSTKLRRIKPARIRRKAPEFLEDRPHGKTKKS